MVLVTAVLGGVLTLKVLQVQGVSAASYAAYGHNEQVERVALQAIRGTIYDRDGDVLATSVPRLDVVADDFLTGSPAERRRAARELGRALAQSPAHVLAELKRKSGYVPLAENVTRATADKLEALGLPFLSFPPDQVREDPPGSLFDPLIGTVGWGGKGLSGLEYLDQRLLAGRAGSEDVLVGAGGGALPGAGQDIRAARQGDGIVLTLDEPLQYEVTNALGAQILAQQAKSGTCIVLDSRTGGVLAMVNLVRHGARVVPAEQNLATNGVYQPGSVMKLATISGALQDQLKVKNGLRPDTEITVPDSIPVGGWTFEDAEYHPTENLPVSQILAQSSNVGTIEIAHRYLGPARLAYYLHDLGFGSKTALDWPGESAGLVPPLSSWSAADMGTIPIGTGEAVTPMQIVDAYNAVANGGEFVPPRLVQALVEPDGKEVVLPAGRRHRVLDRATVAELLPMLEDVTADGTGTLAQIPGFTVAGKTGTAQIPNPNGPGYEPGGWNATFVGFAPAADPKLTAIVVLHHPDAMYGGSASAPVFSTIMSYALRRYDISPTGATTGANGSTASSAP